MRSGFQHTRQHVALDFAFQLVMSNPKGKTMNIQVLVDVYPHPFKPYLDVQFEEWQKSGHVVGVISFSRISGAESPISVKTIKTLREAPVAICLKIILAFMLSPFRMFAVLSTGRGLLGKMKLMAIDCQLPRELPNLFFVHNLAAGARFAYLKQVFPRIPFSLYYHGGEIPGVPSISDDLAKLALIAPDIIFSNTKHSINDVKRRGADESKVMCIPVGFRFEDYCFSPDRGYLKNNRVQLMSIGRVALEKGFDVAIRALAELRMKTHVEVEYTLIGDGPEMQHIRRLAQECGVSNYMNFVGRLSHKEVIAYLANADVLILPSIPGHMCEETQACVMQEAMLMGAVVVASDIGGVSESIPREMCEFLFMAGNHQQLAENVGRLLSTGVDNFRRLGTIGRQFVVENYDVRLLNEKLLRMSIKQS